MCPEAAKAGSVRVYKCLEFPLKCELKKTIMKGVVAVDSMLFEHSGKWWLLTDTDATFFELSVFPAKAHSQTIDGRTRKTRSILMKGALETAGCSGTAIVYFEFRNPKASVCTERQLIFERWWSFLRLSIEKGKPPNLFQALRMILWERITCTRLAKLRSLIWLDRVRLQHRPS
jgi:hypothetical protein